MKQKAKDLNAGLVTLRELAGAMSRSAVGAVTEGEAGTLIAFRDGTGGDGCLRCEGCRSPADRDCRR
ncbi:MAG: hypothetical protein ACLUNS_09205 [Alistipes shahii]